MPAEQRRALGSKYELIEPVGAGSMGEVWRAVDRAGDRQVAAKLLHPQFARNREVKARFVQEWAVLQELRHPHIVEVVDLVVEGDELAIIMAWVEGGPLGEYRRRAGTLPPRLAVALVIPVLDALAFAHERGVLHRDVKPDNVLLAAARQAAPPPRLGSILGGLDRRLADPGPSDGAAHGPDPGETTRLATGAEAVSPRPADVLLGDFGIARLAQASAVQATGLLGTLEYMPPELLSAGHFSAASDVYAVGVTLYELLAGRTPFASPAEPWGAVGRIQAAAPPRLPVDDRLWQLLSITLAKDPRQRWSAAQTAQALRDLPPAALSDDALPPQPEPDWATSPAAAGPPPGPVRIHEVAGDPGRTQLAQTPEDQPLWGAADGAGQRLAGETLAGWAPGGQAGVTLLGAPAVARPPTLQSQAVPPAPPRRLPRWAWAVGAVVVVGLVVGLLWGRGVIGPHDPPTPSPSPSPTLSPGSSHVTGPVLPTGLRIDFDAKPHPQGAAIDVTMTLYASTETGLKGRVLVVIPANGDCLDAEPGASVAPIGAARLSVQGPTEKWAKTTSADGVSVNCGFQTEADIPAAGSARVAFTVSGWPADQAPGDLETWLGGLPRATDEALRQASGPHFALQRLQGISVKAQDVALAGTTPPVYYQVSATWPGQVAPTADDILFNQDTLPYQAGPLLLALTGGEGLDGVEVTGCPPATQPGVQQALTAVQSTPSCELKVRVGTLTATTRFMIAL